MLGDSLLGGADAFGAERDDVAGSSARFVYAGLASLGDRPQLLAWHRVYDPELGRFMSQDPLGLDGGFHRFTTAENRPTTMVDPEGLTAVELGALDQVWGVSAQVAITGVHLPVPTHLPDGTCGLGCVNASGGDDDDQHVVDDDDSAGDDGGGGSEDSVAGGVSEGPEPGDPAYLSSSEQDKDGVGWSKDNDGTLTRWEDGNEVMLVGGRCGLGCAVRRAGNAIGDAIGSVIGGDSGGLGNGAGSVVDGFLSGGAEGLLAVGESFAVGAGHQLAGPGGAFAVSTVGQRARTRLHNRPVSSSASTHPGTYAGAHTVGLVGVPIALAALEPGFNGEVGLLATAGRAGVRRVAGQAGGLVRAGATAVLRRGGGSGGRGAVLRHYTNEVGLKGILERGMLRANGRGQVFATEKALNPAQAFDEIFIGSPTHAGRGEFVIEFSPKPGVTFRPGKPGELVHQGTLRFDRHADVLYAGPNPYP